MYVECGGENRGWVWGMWVAWALGGRGRQGVVCVGGVRAEGEGLHLRREKVVGAADPIRELHRRSVLVSKSFAEPKVGESHMTIPGKEHVARLDVTVDNAAAVEVLHCEQKGARMTCSLSLRVDVPR